MVVGASPVEIIPENDGLAAAGTRIACIVRLSLNVWVKHLHVERPFAKCMTNILRNDHHQRLIVEY